MRHPRRGGALGLATLLLVTAAPAAVLDELRGRWAASPSGPVAMEWAPAGDGFTVSWAPAGSDPTTVQFAPAGRPGIFAGQAKKGWSMMDAMFGEGGPVNPLAGETLFWARTDADTVYVYRLAIDDRGGLELDRYASRVDGGSLAVTLQRRTAEGATEPTEQRLVRVGQ
jgi:hypothetical protein